MTNELRYDFLIGLSVEIGHGGQQFRFWIFRLPFLEAAERLIRKVNTATLRYV